MVDYIDKDPEVSFSIIDLAIELDCSCYEILRAIQSSCTTEREVRECLIKLKSLGVVKKNR